MLFKNKGKNWIPDLHHFSRGRMHKLLNLWKLLGIECSLVVQIEPHVLINLSIVINI